MGAERLAYRGSARHVLVTRALRLSWVSVTFGVLAGCLAVTTGLEGRSLSVFAVGLGVLADVCGSAVLIWRFRAEQRHRVHPHAAEFRAAAVVAAALAIVSVTLVAQTVAALATGSRPGTGLVTLVTAVVSVAILAPLACAKRRLGARMGSAALRGDGALSGIGAATSLLALAALALYHGLGWGWADRVAALAIAAVAAGEAWRAAPKR